MIIVSVIIPTFGKPLFLDKAIKSVLSQTLHDIELIIIDDNNPNSQERALTEELVNSYVSIDSRVKYLKHEKNKNGAVARNIGFAVAQGKYISLLDSDDEYMPERLQKCYNIMETVSDSIAGIYTGCEFRRGGSVYYKYKDVKDGRFVVETLACTFMFCTGSNIFIRKNVVDELNGFDGAFLRHQDYEFLVRVFEKYTLKAIPEILVIKNNENFNLPNVEKQIEIKKQYLAKFDYIIKQLSLKEQNYIYRKNYISIAENALAQKKYAVANEYYAQARSYGQLTIKEWARRIVFPIYTIIKGK